MTDIISGACLLPSLLIWLRVSMATHRAMLVGMRTMPAMLLAMRPGIRLKR